MTIRVTIIDDEENIHEILRAVSEQPASGFHIISAYRHAPDVSRLRSDHPDIILMDIMGCNGIEKAREIADRLPGCKILFFTAYDHPAMVNAAYATGGSGYLTKPVSTEELREAIVGVAQGERFPFPFQAKSMNEDLWERTGLLTTREIEVVHWRAMGLKNKDTGKIMGLSEKRIKNIVSRIFAKTKTSRMEETIALLYRAEILKCGVPPALKNDSGYRARSGW